MSRSAPVFRTEELRNVVSLSWFHHFSTRSIIWHIYTYIIWYIVRVTVWAFAFGVTGTSASPPPPLPPIAKCTISLSLGTSLSLSILLFTLANSRKRESCDYIVAATTTYVFICPRRLRPRRSIRYPLSVFSRSLFASRAWELKRTVIELPRCPSNYSTPRWLFPCYNKHCSLCV